MRPHPRSKRRYWRDRKRQETRLKKRDAALNFLSHAIFSLYPATNWKNLPVFPEAITNTGIIWANIAKPMPMPPNDWMCGFYPGFRSFSPSQGMGRIIENPALQKEIDFSNRWDFRSNKEIDEWRDAMFAAAGMPPPNPWEPAPEDTPDRKVYNDLMSMRLGSFAMPLPPGMDLMRGFDQPYPPVNPTIRVVDAETGQQYYPSELTIATPGANRMRLIHPNGEDLTAKYHILTYDTVTGLISYFHHGGPYDHGHTCIEYIHGIKIIMKP